MRHLAPPRFFGISLTLAALTLWNANSIANAPAPPPQPATVDHTIGGRADAAA